MRPGGLSFLLNQLKIPRDEMAGPGARVNLSRYEEALPDW